MQMTDYPFIVRGRVKKVYAFNYKNALDRILSANLNTFIKTKHAKRMDLINAEKEAQAASEGKKGARYYVTVNAHGELDYSSVIKKGDTVNSVFVGGKRGVLTPDELNTDSKPADKNLANMPASVSNGKAVPGKAKEAYIAKVRANTAKALESNKSIKNIIEKGMKNAEKNKSKGVKKDVSVKKAAGKKDGATLHPRFRPIVGGACLDILNALKKKVCTKTELAKVGKTLETNVAWYIGKIRNNGHKVEVTDKGYALKK